MGEFLEKDLLLIDFVAPDLSFLWYTIFELFVKSSHMEWYICIDSYDIYLLI